MTLARDNLLVINLVQETFNMLKLVVAYPTVLRLEGGVFMIQFFICPLLVGLLVALFEYWLNNRDKK
ncbi:hypothetical protein D932_02082 [Enterococcus casseliflavus 14-MB-W-14]|nr:hypothetical protein D932_02082 [Enterococcus casseliflavus 14-MB-W-14]